MYWVNCTYIKKLKRIKPWVLKRASGPPQERNEAFTKDHQKNPHSGHQFTSRTKLKKSETVSK